MTHSTFGKTGLSVSALGFGAAPIGFLETEQQRVSTMLNMMLDRGVNVIDTAAMYEGSEELIGKAIGHRREEFVLITKCGTKVPDIEGEEWSEQLITQTVDRALRRLKTDRIDVMLLHTCDLATLEKGEALGALVKARDAGKIRFAGYSGDNEAVAHAARLPDVAVIEMSVNICDQANIDAVLPIAREQNVGVLAKRPVANTAWKSAEEQPGFYGGYAAQYADRLRQMGFTPESLGFSGDPQMAWPEIALRFTISHSGVHTALVGTTNPANAEANIRAVEAGPLPTETIEKIRAAFRAAETRSGQQWPALT